MTNSKTKVDAIISDYEDAGWSIESVQENYGKGDKTVNNLIDKLYRVGFKAGLDWKDEGRKLENEGHDEDYVEAQFDRVTDEATDKLKITHGNGNKNLDEAIENAHQWGFGDALEWLKWQQD